MSVGGRDFVGAANFLSGVARAARKGFAAEGTDEGGEDASSLLPEAILERLDRMGSAPIGMIASSFGEGAGAIRPHLERLVELRFVERLGEDDEARYVLTELGHRARKYAQIAQSAP